MPSPLLTSKIYATCEYTTIDISADPTLLALAEEVRCTQRPRLLRRADEDIGMIAPVKKTTRCRARKAEPEKYPTIASLAGAAGTLPASTSWDEVREISRGEHLRIRYATPPSATWI